MTSTNSSFNIRVKDKLSCSTCGRIPNGKGEQWETYLHDAINHETHDCITPNTERLKKFENYSDVIDKMSLSEIIDDIQNIMFFTFASYHLRNLKNVHYSICELFHTGETVFSGLNNDFYNIEIIYRTNSDKSKTKLQVYDKNMPKDYFGSYIESFTNTFSDKNFISGDTVKTKDFILALTLYDNLFEIIFDIQDRKKAASFNTLAKLKYNVEY